MGFKVDYNIYVDGKKIENVKQVSIKSMTGALTINIKTKEYDEVLCKPIQIIPKQNLSREILALREKQERNTNLLLKLQKTYPSIFNVEIFGCSVEVTFPTNNEGDKDSICLLNKLISNDTPFSQEISPDYIKITY